ncbi:MAG: HlyD family secretion protein [Ferruginibacter sp.]
MKTITTDYSNRSFRSFDILSTRRGRKGLLRFLYVVGAISLIILFLPWTQNIRSSGYVTALHPEQRPQTIHSVIAGRIEKWYVREGQFVKKGDTIIQISEVKSEYMNPDLLNNTQQQLQSKNFSVQSYMDKLNSIDAQINAMIATRQQKFEQTRNKLLQSQLKYKNDSIELSAAKLNEQVAEQQLARMEELHKEGLKSLTELESRRIKLQENQVKTLSQLNKITTSKNEVLNAEIELQNINTDFREKVSKLESDKNATFSNMYDAEAAVTKLQNDYVNYSIRSGFYYITAPQDGFITRAIQAGLGEIVKEGTDIVSIMPKNYELAIEMYVQPQDIPLLKKGQKVMIQFDGWPSIIFSGWPGSSYGTFEGRVVAIDNFTSQNGKYRLLVNRDPKGLPWPPEIKLGAGANTFTLLNDVPVWYEMWRQINGFPPDYYQSKNGGDAEIAKPTESTEKK